MIYKTIELTGALLDAAVAKAEGVLVTEADEHPDQLGHYQKTREEWNDHIVNWYASDDDGNPTDEIGGWEPLRHRGSPSTKWADGGPIIDREQISVASPMFKSQGTWHASLSVIQSHAGFEFERVAHGPTPLIAAMRCFVAHKLGDEVEL